MPVLFIDTVQGTESIYLRMGSECDLSKMGRKCRGRFKFVILTVLL